MKVTRSTDLDAVHRLDAAIFGPGGDEPVERIDETTWWLAFDDGRPVGFAGVRLVPGESLLYMVRAGVLESHRGRGLHRRLTRVRLAYGRAMGCEEAITYTLPGNVGSSNNLIRAGFRLFRPGYAWAGDEGVLYWAAVL